MRNGKTLCPAARPGLTRVTRTCFYLLLLLIVSAAKKARVEVIDHTESDPGQRLGVRDQVLPLGTLPKSQSNSIRSTAPLLSGGTNTPCKLQLSMWALCLHVWADAALTAPVRSQE